MFCVLWETRSRECRVLSLVTHLCISCPRLTMLMLCCS
ncbi:unnamed protein product, partial [Staurois parvus]